MALLGDIFRDRAFVQGGNILGMAEAMDHNGHFGPAAYLYGAAADKLAYGGGVPYQIREIREHRDRCFEKAAARGEDARFAFEVGWDTIGRFPDHFLKWYYDQQEGNRYPWHTPTVEELAEEARQAELAEKTRKKRELKTQGEPLFKDRFEDLLAAAAKSAEGDEAARALAVNLYRRPSDRKDWGEEWSKYARRSLNNAREQCVNDPSMVKAIGEMPNIAYQAEVAVLRRDVIGAIAGSVAWPVCYGLFRFIDWILPSSDHMSLIMWPIWVVLGLIGLVCMIVAWLAKWLTVPWILGWAIAFSAHYAPRIRRMKRAVEARDLSLLKKDDLFSPGAGKPIQSK